MPVSGLGCGLTSTPGPIVLNYYFSKKRSLAVALSLLTNGLGGAIYAPFVSYLFDYYGYTGTLMVLGALLLHTSILAAAMVYIVPKRFRRVNNKPNKMAGETGAKGHERNAGNCCDDAEFNN